MKNLIQFRSEIRGTPDKAIIALHGWQGNGENFHFLADTMRVEDVEWYFPDAPYILNNNPETRSWSYEKSPGIWEIEEPNHLLKHFFDTEIFSRIKPENVYIIGFSQGAIICYEFALYLDTPLGGVFPIAGMFREKNNDKPRFHPRQKNTPIVIAHGRDDTVVDIEYSRKIYSLLASQNANVKLIEYNGGHRISLQYLKEITKLINES